MIDPQNSQRTKPRLRRVRSCCRHQTRVARRARVGIQTSYQRLEGPAPARGERRDSQRPLELIARVVGGVQQRIDLRNGHALLPSSDQEDRVTGADLTFLEDAEVEARPSAGGQESSHLRLVRANPDAVAGDPGLGHLEQSSPDPEAVADADLVIRQPLDGEVLAELPVGEIAPAQLLRPVAIRFDLINENRTLLPPVSAEISLPVAFDVQPLDAATTLHRFLPDGRAHGSSAPLDVSRQADVDGE